MKTIKSICNDEIGELELMEKEAGSPHQMSNFIIWFNGSIIADAKTLKGALSKFDKLVLKHNF